MEQTKKREPFKVIELSGRQWRIGRFDALTGSYIAYQLMFQMLPTILTAFAGKVPEGEGFIADLPKTGSIMNRAEFTSLQRDCLGVCSEISSVLNGQETQLPVLMSSGAWGVPRLEDDTMTVLGLTVHALIFNVSGFFAEGPLKDLLKAVPGGQADSSKSGA